MINEKYLEMYKEERKKSLLFDFTAFIILILIYEERYDFLEIGYHEDYMKFVGAIERLESCGLVKWHGTTAKEITMRKAGEDLFRKYVGLKKKGVTAKEVGTWIDSWREIFPAGVNNGGYRYRGDRGEVLKKMIKFVNTYKYTTEQIFQATKNYVERFSLKGYEFMQQAHYFIDKKGVGSTLNAECEGLKDDKGTKPEGSNYGGEVV